MTAKRTRGSRAGKAMAAIAVALLQVGGAFADPVSVTLGIGRGGVPFPKEQVEHMDLALQELRARYPQVEVVADYSLSGNGLALVKTVDKPGPSCRERFYAIEAQVDYVNRSIYNHSATETSIRCCAGATDCVAPNTVAGAMQALQKALSQSDAKALRALLHPNGVIVDVKYYGHLERTTRTLTSQANDAELLGNVTVIHDDVFHRVNCEETWASKGVCWTFEAYYRWELVNGALRLRSITEDMSTPKNDPSAMKPFLAAQREYLAKNRGKGTRIDHVIESFDEIQVIVRETIRKGSQCQRRRAVFTMIPDQPVSVDGTIPVCCAATCSPLTEPDQYMAELDDALRAQDLGRVARLINPEWGLTSTMDWGGASESSTDETVYGRDSLHRVLGRLPTAYVFQVGYMAVPNCAPFDAKGDATCGVGGGGGSDDFVWRKKGDRAYLVRIASSGH